MSYLTNNYITTKEDYEQRKAELAGIKDGVRRFREANSEPPPGEPSWQLLHQVHDEMIAAREADIKGYEYRFLPRSS